MDDDDFNRLKHLVVPAPSPEARRRALGASLMAFDKAAAPAAEKFATPPQGTSLWQRLKSIVPPLKGNWTMDSRLIPFGTAALVLLLLPLGYELYTSTALTPLHPALPIAEAGKDEAVIVAPKVPVTDAPTGTHANTSADGTLAGRDTTTLAPAEPVAAAKPLQAELPVSTVPPAQPAPTTLAMETAPVDAAQAGGGPMATPAAIAANPGPTSEVEQAPLADADTVAASEVPATPPALRSLAAPPMMKASAPSLRGSIGVGAFRGDASVASMPAPEAAASVAGGVAMDQLSSQSYVPPVATTPSGDKFQSFTESPQKAVATDPVSTFSIDVDTASYSYLRRSLNEGRVPEPDAVRLEEMINYFPYDYPAASSADQPFKPTISVFPTPWNHSTELMQIGIKGFEPPASEQKPANLVFLIDTSGSMDEPDKLPLLQHALTLLVNTLPPEDTVSIVAYAGSAGVVLEPTKATERAKILNALDNLEAGGSTAGAEGIELAYRLAEQHKLDGGNNRVILATDGDFNVGISDPAALKKFIKAKRSSGISLSVLGFGEGNLDDETMQALAQNGDGNASYIDSLSEAQKVLVKEAGSTLDTIAKDVKIQVEFNPATVSSYRLIGYETRALNREDFNNDKVDAGDVGAGHTVTALYEITPVGADVTPPVDALRYGAAAPAADPAAVESSTPTAGKRQELADFKLRYKLPGSDTSRLIEQPVGPEMVASSIAGASDDARWAAAVAAFGQKLKGSDYAGALSYGDIAQLAKGARGSDPDGYRSEFINLVGLAASLTGADRKPATNGGFR